MASIAMQHRNATTKLPPIWLGSARLTGSTSTCVADGSTLVGRRAIHTWDRSTKCSEVAAQLRAMMNKVINHPGAVDRIARIVDPDLVVCGHLPVIVPFGRIETQKNLLYVRRICV